jgi:hypothetical protein
MALTLPFVWTNKASTPYTINWQILRYLNGKLYSVVFQDGPGYLGLLVYTIATDSWEYKTGPVPHDNHYAQNYRNQLAVVDGKLYFVRPAYRWPTGVPTHDAEFIETYGSLQVYDEKADTWSVLATFDIDLQPHWRPYQRSSDGPPPVTVLEAPWDITIGIGTTMYSVGYVDKPDPHTNERETQNYQFWGYDVRTDTFTQLADRPTNSGTYAGDVVLAANGSTVFVYENNDGGMFVSAYTIASNTWARLPTPPGPIVAWPGFVVDGTTLYMLGGRLDDGSNIPQSAIYQLLPGAPAWTKIGDLPIPRYAFGCIVAEGGLYITAGATADQTWTDNVYLSGGVVPPRYLRMTQRDDGLGIARSPRLAGAGSNGSKSIQSGKPPRVGTNNTYR